MHAVRRVSPETSDPRGPLRNRRRARHVNICAAGSPVPHVKLHASTDRNRLTPVTGHLPPKAHRSMHAVEALPIGSVPKRSFRGGHCAPSSHVPSSLSPKWGTKNFWPMSPIWGTTSQKRARLFLTHPPVVFGPHRSPRGEGHTIFWGRPLDVVCTTFGLPSDPSPSAPALLY